MVVCLYHHEKTNIWCFIARFTWHNTNWHPVFYHSSRFFLRGQRSIHILLDSFRHIWPEKNSVSVFLYYVCTLGDTYHGSNYTFHSYEPVEVKFLAQTHGQTHTTPIAVCCIFALFACDTQSTKWQNDFCHFTPVTLVLFIPAKARDYGITGVGLSVCLFVSLFVTTITK